MTDLLELEHRPPRIDHDVWSERERCIGLLIDWLDSRPGNSATDTAALQRKGKRGDIVAMAAGTITGRLELEWAQTDGRIEYPADYRVYFHDIAGYLADDEVAIGNEVYRALYAVDPNCLSALFNLAELERRSGYATDAHARLLTALELATTKPSSCYGIESRHWIPILECAIARISHEAGADETLLANATCERLSALVAALEAFGSQDDATRAAHAAFSVATAEQRIMLDAAMRLAHLPVRVAPAAHTQFDSFRRVQELVRGVEAARDAENPPPSTELGPFLKTISKLGRWFAKR